MIPSNRKLIRSGFLLVLLALLLAFPLSTAFAASVGTPGQPGQSCQAVGVTPGNAANAPGSAFNTSGVAGSMYAGSQPQNSNNVHSVSQYDVACFQVAQH